SVYKPVVPTTIFVLERMHAKMLSSTAPGVVKSRTTLILLRRSGVKAEALGFSLPVSTETSWPRSRATPMTKEPVLPRPRTKIFMTRERSEEHTSELQSRGHLVCRLLLEKK